MRTVTLSVILLWLAASLAGSAAEPPPAAKSAPTPAPAVKAGAGAASAAGKAPATAPAPAAASEQATEPDRIDPTEKVHSDSEISFPVDI